MKIIKNKDFMLLWTGQTVSKLGTAIYNIALMWYIYKRTGSSLALGLSVLCFTIPTVLIAPLAGVFADRLDKKKIIISTDTVNGFIMLSFSYFIFADKFPTYVLYIFMVLASIVTEIFNPAISSAIPIMVEEDDLRYANTLSQIASQITSILGPALAGILIAFIHMWLLFFINGLSFLFCAIIESFINIPKITSKKSIEKISSSFKEGLAYVIKDKALLYLVISGGVIINLFLAPLSIYETILSTKILKVGSTGYGMMNSALSIGALIGALLIFLNVLNDKYKIAIIGLCLEGVAVTLLGLIPNFYVALIAEGTLGLGTSMASVGISTLYQSMIPKDKMGRVIALVSTLCSVTVPLGTLLGSTVVMYISLNLVLAVSGMLILLSGALLVPALGFSFKGANENSTLK